MTTLDLKKFVNDSIKSNINASNIGADKEYMDGMSNAVYEQVLKLNLPDQKVLSYATIQLIYTYRASNKTQKELTLTSGLPKGNQDDYWKYICDACTNGNMNYVSKLCVCLIENQMHIGVLIGNKGSVEIVTEEPTMDSIIRFLKKEGITLKRTKPVEIVARFGSRYSLDFSEVPVVCDILTSSITNGKLTKEMIGV